MTNGIDFCYFNLRSQNFVMSYWYVYIILLSRLLEDSPPTIPQQWQYHRHSEVDGRKSWSPTLRQETTDNWWPLREGELAFPKDEHPNWLSSTKWSALKSYVHRQQKGIPQIILMYLCTDTHLYLSPYIKYILIIIIRGEHSINLRVDGDMERVGGKELWRGWREEREGEMNVILLN